MSVRVSIGFMASMTNVRLYIHACARHDLHGSSPPFLSSFTTARQTSIQHQAMENIHGLLQLPTHRRYHRRENLYDARRSFTRSTVDGTDTAGHATDRRSRHWYVTLFASALLRPRHATAFRVDSTMLISFPHRSLVRPAMV